MGDTVRAEQFSQLMKTNPSAVDTNAPDAKPEAHRSSNGLRPPTSAFENTLVRQFTAILQCRPQQSLLLSDLGALMNMNLRHAIKENGGLRRWIQQYPEHFVITEQPGKELVSLVEPRTDDKENEPPRPENRRRVSRSSVDNSDGADHSNDDAENLRGNRNEQRGRVENDGQLDNQNDIVLGLDHGSDDDYEGVFKAQPILQLRGIPFRAQVDDILCFLGEHVAFLKPPARNNIQIVLQRDGRPSGFARVKFLTAQFARECRDRLHMRRMDDRYVEIFLHNERRARPKNDDQRYSVHHMPRVYEEKNSDSAELDEPSKVLRECVAYLKQQGKFVLLSMLGVALSPQSREYLKQNDQGLKQFLANYPQLCVEGKNGCEWVGFSRDSNTYQSEKSAKKIPTAAPLPVVSALALHHASPQVQQEQKQLVRPYATGSCARPKLQQKQKQQAQLHVAGSSVSTTHDAQGSDGASRSPQSTSQFQPRLAELLTPPSPSNYASAEASAKEMTPTAGQPSSIPYNLGLQHHRIGLHYPNDVHLQYFKSAQPQLVPVGDDAHQHVSSLHVEHTATQCPAQTLSSPATPQQSLPQLMHLRTAPQPSTHSRQHKQEQDISHPTAPLYVTLADAQCQLSPRSAQRPSLPNRLTEPLTTAKIDFLNTRYKVPDVPRKKIASTHLLGAPAVAERDNATKDSLGETPPTAFFESTLSDWGTPPCVDSMDGWTVQNPRDLLSRLRQSERTTERGTVWDGGASYYLRTRSTDTLGQSGMSSSTLMKRAVYESSTVTGPTCLPASTRDACSARGSTYTSDTQDLVEFLPAHNLADKVLTDDQYAIANSSMDTSGSVHVPGRPSHDEHTQQFSEGCAGVHSLTAQSARGRRDALHMRHTNDRYVEVFLHDERHSRPKNDDQSHSVHHRLHVYEEKNSAERDAPSKVLRECVTYLKQQGKFVLLSMLGAALSPQSREYLKQNDQGLKQFLDDCPELCVEGESGSEQVGLTCDSNAYQSEKNAKRTPSATQRPVVSALALHHASPQVHREQEQLVQPDATGSRASPKLQQKQKQQAQLHVTGSSVSTTHDTQGSDGASRSSQSTSQFQPRLVELLTPPSLPNYASAEAYAEEMTPTAGQPLSSIPYDLGLQHQRIGLHYPNAVHPQYLQPGQPQVVPVRDDTHQYVSSLHVEHTATQCPSQTLSSPATSQPWTHSHQNKQEQDISCPTAPLYVTLADAQCHLSSHSAERPSLPNCLTEPLKTAKVALQNTRYKVPNVPRKKIASSHLLGAPAVAELDNSTKDSPGETPPTAFFESTLSDCGTSPCVDSIDGWTVQNPSDLLSSLRQSECTTERGTVWDDGASFYSSTKSTGTLGQSGMSSSTLTKRAVNKLSTATSPTCRPASTRDACSARARRYTSDTQNLGEFLPAHNLADKVLTDDQYAIASSSMDTSVPEYVPWRPFHDKHTQRLSEGHRHIF